MMKRFLAVAMIAAAAMKSLKPREGTTAASFDCCVVAGARGPGESIPKAGAY